jgi:hypothetical protein
MNGPTATDWIQAGSAVAIVILTVVLAIIALRALDTANKQSESAAKAIGEVIQDRHLGAVPMLGIKPGKVEWPSDEYGNPSMVLLITNDTDAPALNVCVKIGEVRDLAAEPDSWAAVPPPVPWIGGHGETKLPIPLNLFTPVYKEKKLRTSWAMIRVTYEGALRAKVTQTLYWSPNDWEGFEEPQPGKGELLRLWSIKGTSGAQPDDISWDWSPRT